MRNLTLGRLCIALLLLAPVDPAFGSRQGSSDDDWLAGGVEAQIPKYAGFTFRPHPASRGVVAANCETEVDWWGTLRVFHRTGDHVDWIAELPEEFAKEYGNYLVSCEWRYLPKLRRWVLEVFGSTHLGNGDLWLFALDGRELRVLLRAKAAGRVFDLETLRRLRLRVPFEGEARFVERHLKVTYPPARSSRRQVVVLSGTVATLNQEGRRVRRKKFMEQWVWFASTGRFEPARR